MAQTFTEIYRPYKGKLAPHALRFVPLYLADLRASTRRKLPMIILFAVPAIGGIIFSFLVYLKYTLSEGAAPSTFASPLPMGKLAGNLIQVREQIAQFNIQCRTFALLAIAWFGAGLIANDRKTNAHLLYFSRPMTRMDYVLGHFLTVATFGVYAQLVPVLLICLSATFNSPDFSFLTDEWPLILASIGYGLMFVCVTSSIVLAISSLFKRKAFALVGVIGVFFGASAIPAVLWHQEHDARFMMLSFWGNFERLGDWMLGRHPRMFTWDPWWSLAIVAGVTIASFGILAWRVKRMEVVS